MSHAGVKRRKVTRTTLNEKGEEITETVWEDEDPSEEGGTPSGLQLSPSPTVSDLGDALVNKEAEGRMIILILENRMSHGDTLDTTLWGVLLQRRCSMEGLSCLASFIGSRFWTVACVQR